MSSSSSPDPNSDSASNHSSPSQNESSSSSFALLQVWENFMDQQRLGRLGQCRPLETVLRDCQQFQIKGVSLKKPLQLEETVPGIRMARYFGWRTSETPDYDREGGITEENSVAEKEDPIKKTAAETKPIPQLSCARETHSLWACRAVALACGSQLGHLKDCFLQKENMDKILAEPRTAYDTTHPLNKENRHTKQIPCRELQEALGACVKSKGAEMEQRVNRARRQS